MYLKFNTQLQPQKRKKWIKQKCIVFQVVLSRYSMLNIFWQDHFKPCFFLVKRCFYFKMLFYQWVFTLSLKLILLRSFNLYFSFWLHKKCPYLGLFWSAFFQHFPAFGLNTKRYGVSLHIQSGYGRMLKKCGPE